MDATQAIAHHEQYVDQPARRREDATEHLEPIDVIPARAIVLGLVLGSAMWAVIIGIGWLIFR